MDSQSKEHSDKKFISGFGRYVFAGFVLDSISWKDIFFKIEEYEMEEFEMQSFLEYKLFNVIYIIHYLLADFLELLVEENKINISSVKKILLNTIKQSKNFRNKNYEEAETFLDKETNGKDKNLLSPYVLFYIAHVGLGEIKNIIQNSVKIRKTNKQKLISMIEEFNYNRNIFIHNLMSTRVDQIETIRNGIQKGSEIIELLESYIINDDSFSEDGAVKYGRKIKEDV